MFYRNENDRIYNIYRTNVILESDQSDGPELSYAGEMDKEQLERFDTKLGKAKLWLYKRNQYLVYANVLSGLRTVPCRAIVAKNSGAQQSIDTMAVDPLGNLLINPEFLESLTEGQVIAILVHESFHHLNDTFGRKGIRDMTRWNIATDFIMNRDILKDGLEISRIIDGKTYCVPEEENGKFYIKEKDQMGNSINIDITTMTCEELYNVLDKQLPQPPKPPDNPKPNGNPPPPPDNPPPKGNPPPPSNNPPPPVKIQIGDPVETKDGKVRGVFRGINPMNNEAMIEDMTEQEIRDYIKKRRSGV